MHIMHKSRRSKYQKTSNGALVGTYEMLVLPRSHCACNRGLGYSVGCPHTLTCSWIVALLGAFNNSCLAEVPRWIPVLLPEKTDFSKFLENAKVHEMHA